MAMRRKIDGPRDESYTLKIMHSILIHMAYVLLMITIGVIIIRAYGG